MTQPTSGMIPLEEQLSVPPKLLLSLARTWAGGLALAWDELNALAHTPATIIARGEALERTLLERWRSLGEQTRAGTHRMTLTLRSPLDWVVGGVQQGSAQAEEELERQIELALDRLGIPSRERLMQLGEEIDALAERIDAELARQIA